MIYGYIRVSTNKQTTENQKWEIQQYCNNHGIIVDKWVEETISATKDLKSRKLGKLIKKLHSNDIVIASELSRLGRKLLEVMDLFRKVMLQRKASYLNLTMRAYDYIIVTEIITNVLAGLIYGE